MKTITIILIAILGVAVVFAILLMIAGSLFIIVDTETSRGWFSSFEECAAAGNPVMESYPRQCRDPVSEKTFTEEIGEEYEGNVGESCSVNEDCRTPMEYLVQSNCPFGSACIENTCRVVCPMTYHDVNPEISKSYAYSCEKDSDCNCDERGERSLECLCLEGSCISVEE